MCDGSVLVNRTQNTISCFYDWKHTVPESHAKKRFSGKFCSLSADVISSSPVLLYPSTQKCHSSFSLSLSLSFTLTAIFDLRNQCQADKSCHLKLRTTRCVIFQQMEGQTGKPTYSRSRVYKLQSVRGKMPGSN
jgi:hypothetical protein